MFRINVYTDRETRRRAARRGMVQLGIYATVLGINALMIVFLLVSNGLLQDRRDTVAREVRRIADQASRRQVSDADVALAREMFRIRRTRIEWAPILASVSESLPDDLILEEMQGRTARRRVGAEYILVGKTRTRGADVAAVSRFIDALRDDDRVTAQFQDVSLGTVNSGTGDFEVVCEPREK